MNHLNQIISNNNNAGAADAQRQRTLGKFVVQHFAGLSYLSHSIFDTRAAADGYVAAQGELPIGERLVVQDPVPPAAYVPSGDAPATLASLRQDHEDRVARNEAARQVEAAEAA